MANTKLQTMKQHQCMVLTIMSLLASFGVIFVNGAFVSRDFVHPARLLSMQQRHWHCYDSAAALHMSETESLPKVLCVGEALLDCISNENGLSAKDMVEGKAWTAFPGGASANVATACCKLGTRSGFCGCVGQDDDGDFLAMEFQNCGVDVTLLCRSSSSSEHPTRRVMVTRDKHGDRSFAGFYENRATDSFADCFLNVKDLLENHASSETLGDMLSNLEWIVTGTLGLAYPQSSRAMHDLVHQACNSTAKLVVDVNWRPIFWQCDEDEARKTIMQFVQKAHVVKLTDQEAEWLLEDITSTFALEHPETVHQYFPNALAVFVTAGELGASYSVMRGKHTGRIPVFHVDAIETTGAGDGFLAGILHGLVQHPNLLLEDNDEVDPSALEQLVTFASAVGALTCTSEGAIAAQPTMAQVESFLIHGEKLWT